MALTITQAASSKDLTTAERVLEELRLSHSNAHNHETIIKRLITQVSHLIENRTGRVFAKETVKETKPSDGTPRLVLSRRPVRSIVSIKEDDTLIDASNYEIEDADSGFIFKETIFDSSPIYYDNIELTPSRFGKFVWEIEYEAGYVLPSMSGTVDLPQDIERACIDAVKMLYSEIADAQGILSNPRLSRISMGDSSESYDRRIELPSSSMDVIERWQEIYG